MRPTGTTRSTGCIGRTSHGTRLRSAALGARRMALGCVGQPGWLCGFLCSEPPAHCACGTRALTHPFVLHLGQRGDTQKGAGEKLVDEVRSKRMMSLVG